MSARNFYLLKIFLNTDKMLENRFAQMRFPESAVWL